MEYYEFLENQIEIGDLVTDLEGRVHVVEEILYNDDHEEGAGLITSDGVYIPHVDIWQWEARN